MSTSFNEWSAISSAQQSQFLQATGLEKLPDPAALSNSQMSTLAGIVGEQAAKSLRSDAVGGTVSDPVLPPPDKAYDWSNIMMMVTAMQMELGELQINASSEKIEADRDSVIKTNELEMSKLKDRIEELHKQSNSSLVSKIFGWIGAIVGLIGAAIATVATGGAALPGLIAAGLAVTAMALQEAGVMDDIVNCMMENPAVMFAIPVLGLILAPIGMAAKNGDLDEDTAKIIMSAVTAVFMLAVSIVTTIASGGAGVGGKIGKAADKINDLAHSITKHKPFQKTKEVFDKMSSGIMGRLTKGMDGDMSKAFIHKVRVGGLGTQVASDVIQMGKSGADIAGAAYSYEAAQSQADSQEIQAMLAKLQAMMSEEADRLMELMQMLNGMVGSASEILNDIGSSHNSVIKNMGV